MKYHLCVIIFGVDHIPQVHPASRTCRKQCYLLRAEVEAQVKRRAAGHSHRHQPCPRGCHVITEDVRDIYRNRKQCFSETCL